MLKSLFIFVGDGANRANPATSGEASRPLKDQKFLRCAEAVGWAQKALVMAVAQNRARRERAVKFSDWIGELEQRAALVLGTEDKDVAMDAAEAIAWLEGARECEAAALSGFAEEFTALRQLLRTAKVQLRKRQQGSGATEGNDAVWWRRDQGPSDIHEGDREGLGAAETALARLYERQAEFDHVKVVLRRLDGESDIKAIARTIADAGYAAPGREKAHEVLERLRTAD